MAIGTVKLPKWALALIIVVVILGVLAGTAGIVIVVMSKNAAPAPEPAGTTDAIMNVNGYQQKVADASTLAVVNGGKIVSISEMLTDEGLDINKAEDKAKIAEYIYNMAVRNYASVNGSAYAVLTDASVEAQQVTATLPVLGELSMDYFDVGIRSTYSYMSGPKGYFSQTISGVTKLNLQGMEAVGDVLKGLFGYNIQSCGNDDFDAFRKASNGGATFLSEEKGGYKYILGATKSSSTKFPTKTGDNFTITAKEASVATPSPLFTTDKWWAALPDMPNLDAEGNPIKIETTVYEQPYTYYTGSYGAGWAKYNFQNDYLDLENTKVEYSAKDDIYTLTIAVKEDKIDEACKYAKGDLIKDTKDYLLLQNPKYTKLENTIQVYGNGLIKCWVRDEVMGSTEKAKLVVLPGEAAGGGKTGNASVTIFSYDERDYNAERLAALYWPELGKATLFKGAVANKQLDLSAYPTLETYAPDVWGKPYAPKA
ncbi:MAG: hypothetical protein ACI4M5_00480 [Christensenellales bacterium]